MNWTCAGVVGIFVGLTVGVGACRLPVLPVIQSVAAVLATLLLSSGLTWFLGLRYRNLFGDAGAVEGSSMAARCPATASIPRNSFGRANSMRRASSIRRGDQSWRPRSKKQQNSCVNSLLGKGGRRESFGWTLVEFASAPTS